MDQVFGIPHVPPDIRIIHGRVVHRQNELDPDQCKSQYSQKRSAGSNESPGPWAKGREISFRHRYGRGMCIRWIAGDGRHKIAPNEQCNCFSSNAGFALKHSRWSSPTLIRTPKTLKSAKVYTPARPNLMYLPVFSPGLGHFHWHFYCHTGLSVLFSAHSLSSGNCHRGVLQTTRRTS